MGDPLGHQVRPGHDRIIRGADVLDVEAAPPCAMGLVRLGGRGRVVVDSYGLAVADGLRLEDHFRLVPLPEFQVRVRGYGHGRPVLLLLLVLRHLPRIGLLDPPFRPLTPDPRDVRRVEPLGPGISAIVVESDAADPQSGQFPVEIAGRESVHPLGGGGDAHGQDVGRAGVAVVERRAEGPLVRDDIPGPRQSGRWIDADDHLDRRPVPLRPADRHLVLLPGLAPLGHVPARLLDDFGIWQGSGFEVAREEDLSE